MKGIGWIVILLGLLGVTYLVTRDLGSLRGEREGKVVVEPLQKAKEAADVARQTQKALDQGLNEAQQ